MPAVVPTAPPAAYLVAVLLGIGQIVAYGTMYYAFGILADDIAGSIGFSVEAVYGVFSLALLIGGLSAPRLGRLLDEMGAARAMAAGSAVTALAFLGLGLPSPAWLVVGCILVSQIVSTLVQYEGAFVVAARLAPDHARRTITGITLIGGFASTVFWPLTGYLADIAGWRSTMLVFAGLHLCLCLPIHLWLARFAEERTGVGRPASTAASPSTPTGSAIGGPVSPPGGSATTVFALVLLGFAASGFLIAAIHLHLIRTLEMIGLGTSATLIGALLGPFQVVGRIIEFASSHRLSIFLVAVTSTAAMPLALMLLIGGAPALWAGLAFALFFGLGQGLNYIVRGVLPLAIYGSDRLGAIMGRINGVRMVVTALAPFAFALVFERLGPSAALLLAIMVGILATIAFAALAWIMRNRPHAM